MGTYYYLDDPESDGGVLPVYEDDYLQAIFNIASKQGVKITDKMILEEVKKKWQTKKSKRKRKR